MTYTTNLDDIKREYELLKQQQLEKERRHDIKNVFAAIGNLCEAFKIPEFLKEKGLNFDAKPGEKTLLESVCDDVDKGNYDSIYDITNKYPTLAILGKILMSGLLLNVSKQYKKDDRTIKDECCICYDAVTNVKTNCNHWLCKTCLDSLKEKICPLCRANITDFEVFY